MENKELKDRILSRIKENPKEFLPVEELEKEGFKRYVCKACGRHFWSKVPRDYCGNPDCIGGYTFLTRPIVKEKISTKEIWKRFVSFFESLGHKEIKRYPVVARWRDDIYFVEAAIDDFAPYVIDGVAEPPENPLVIGQPCIRFNDTENVGLTGRHLTTFIMAEQAAFNTETKKTYFDKEAWIYIYNWIIKGLKIPESEITFVEDAWVGAGYAGNSLEYFAGGLELGNQVYMRFRIINGELVPIKVKTIDMGAGLERWSWMLNNTPTVYEATFPNTSRILKEKMNIKLSEEEILKIYERLGYYDYYEKKLDEVIPSINQLIGKDVRAEIEKLRYIYSLMDHARTLLIAINDGALPSNVGGGYNLRYLIRRLRTLKRLNKFDIDLLDVIDLVKQDMDMFPEIKDLDISEIIKLEEQKFDEVYEKGKGMIDKIIKKGITTEDLKLLYQSLGIRKEDVLLRAEELGIKVTLPEIQQEKETKESKKEEIKYDLPPTRKLFYETESTEAKARIIKIDGNRIILDQTIFYPEMGGQKADNGYIDNVFVNDVQIYNGVIVHFVDGKLEKKEGDEVTLKVDERRRQILRVHHSATHILNKSAKEILGRFVNQAGAKKDVDYAHLDITFYRMPTPEEIKKIEKLANEIVRKDLPIEVVIMDRTEAEVKYGMEIYQGGVVPEKNIRIVRVDDFDVEACGGLHCKKTGEIGLIKIFDVRKVQDGVIRLSFKAGEKALEYVEKIEDERNEIKDLLKSEDIVEEVGEIFEKYKKYKELFEKSEKEKIKALIGKEKIIKSELEDVAGLIKELPKEDFVIIGKRNAIGRKTEENEKILKENGFEKIIEKGEFIIGVK